MRLPSWITWSGAPSLSPEASALISDLNQWAAQGKLIGGTAMIVREGRTALLEPFGMQDRERAIPARRDTIFAITSLTKAVTCTAAMVLIDAGKLSLDTPVERVLTAFKGQRLWDGSAPAEPVLVRHLMNHSSGLIDATPEAFLATDYSLAELVDLASTQPLAFVPGQRWSYANLGLNVLGRMVETVSGQPFHEFIEQTILRPLHMKDSFFSVPRRFAHRVAAPYKPGAEGLVREPLRCSSGSRFTSPSNGLHTTASDLARFWQMLLQKGISSNRRILSRESAEAIVTSQTGAWEAGFIAGCGYGLGCSVVTQPRGMFESYAIGTFGHGGFFQTHIWADPAANSIAIILCQHRCPAPVSDEVAAFVSRAPRIM